MSNDLGTTRTGNSSKALHCSPTNSVKGSCVLVQINSVIINLFFDGTKNNFYNTRDREAFKEQIYKDLDEYESYTNAYSNVAHLYNQRLVNSANAVWVYIEGAGSALAKEQTRGNIETLQSQGKKDDMQGFAFGSGSTGIEERAKLAFARIKQEFELRYGKGNKPNILTINIYGFSRGAATARHFIHIAKTQPNLFEGWDLTANKIRFKFIGIFDTVSSFHKNFSETLNFQDDVQNLTLNFSDLNSSDKKITKVFHIVAMDEYREYFSVTNINSALRDGYGIEVYMNGAHSDIGGSYPGNVSDSYDVELNDTALFNWLIQKGYYRSDQHIRHPPTNWFASEFYRFSRTSTNNQFDKHDIHGRVKNDIHKISLKMMRLMAQKYGSVQFKRGILAIEKPHNFVQGIMGNFPDQIIQFSQNNWGGTKDFTLKESDKNIKRLRNHFVHFSAKYIKGTAIKDLGYKIWRGETDNQLPSRQTIEG